MYFPDTIGLSKKTDERILSGLDLLISRDRRRKADFLAYLNEVDKRRLYAKQGYSSLFRFLTEKHGLSESSALKRIQTARLAAAFPFLYRDIAQGLYSLTALSRLAPFLRGYNAARLLNQCARKTVREVEAMLVREFPKAGVEEKLKKKVSPLGEGRIAVQFTASEAFGRDLEKAKALLSRRLPQCRMADVLGLALGLLLEDLEKGGKKVGRRLAENRKICGKKELKVESSPLADDQRASEDGQDEEQNLESLPLASNQSVLEDHQGIHGTQKVNPEGDDLKITGHPMSRYIPRGMQKTVWHRDGGRCQYPRPDGTVCGETHFLELDHVHPFSLKGPHSQENLRLLCWTHNQLRAEARFGRWRRNHRSR